MSKRKMPPKQQKFVKEYLVDLNAKQAAIRAGYSKKTAEVIGWQLLKKTLVQEAIQAARDRIEKKTDITIEKCLKEYAKIAFLNIKEAFNDDGTIKGIHEIPDNVAEAIAGLETSNIKTDDGKFGTLHKIKISDKKGALDSIMRHLGGFEDKIKCEHTGKGGGPIQITEQREAIEERLKNDPELAKRLKDAIGG